MLEIKLTGADCSSSLLETSNKKINLQFELKSRDQLKKLILEAIDLLLENVDNAKRKRFFAQIFTDDQDFNDWGRAEVEYLTYELLRVADKDDFWDYNLVIKLINKFNYTSGKQELAAIKEQLKDYFSQILSSLEEDVYALNQAQDSELATVVNLVISLVEEKELNWRPKDLLLIKLQLIDLDLRPQQKINLKAFYGYLNSNPKLCTKFRSEISTEEYQNYKMRDIPLVAGIVELEKLINNDDYLCQTVVDKIKGLGLNYDQQEFNLEILEKCLRGHANFDLNQDLELFNLIVELVTDLTAVSKVREANKAGQKLISAIKNEKFARAKELIAEQAEVNLTDEHGKTPLIWAAEVGNEELIFDLMEAGAKLDVTDEQGRTVLSKIHNCYQMQVMQRLNRNNN